MTDASSAFDARAFRRCLGQFPTGVTVVTAEHEGKRAGVTANSFSSLSLDPPLILWSINRTSRSMPVFEHAQHFAVNVLGTEQIAVSQHFSSGEADKFARAAWQPGHTGAPLLDGVVASMECRTEVRHDGGDHLLIVGRVLHFTQGAGAPLLFAQGRYGIAEDHPDLKPEQEALPGPGVPGMDGGSLISLLVRVHHATIDRFMTLRQAESMSIPQIRILTELYDAPGTSLERLYRRAFLGQRDTADALAELAEGGLVRKVGEGYELTDAGRVRKEDLTHKTLAFEAEHLLAGVPEAEVAAGRKLLERLIARTP